jgi:hypothetical protein
MLKVTASDPLTRFRGDTLGDKFVVTSNGTTPQDLTGFTARLTVNTVKEPTVTDLPLFTVVGVIEDAPGGVLLFNPSLGQVDQVPGKYFYDVELTTPTGKIITVAKGTYTIKQDISK